MVVSQLLSGPAVHMDIHTPAVAGGIAVGSHHLEDTQPNPAVEVETLDPVVADTPVVLRSLGWSMAVVVRRRVLTYLFFYVMIPFSLLILEAKHS